VKKKIALQLKDNFGKVKTVGVLGWGLSAQGAAYLARKKLNKKVVVSSNQSGFSSSEQKLINSLATKVELGKHSSAFLKEADIWILSPGIKPSSQVFYLLEKLHIPWVGEIEFASWFCPAPIIAVTGTNGKTTTSALLAYVLYNLGSDPTFLIGGLFCDIDTNFYLTWKIKSIVKIVVVICNFNVKHTQEVIAVELLKKTAQVIVRCIRLIVHLLRKPMHSAIIEQRAFDVSRQIRCKPSDARSFIHSIEASVIFDSRE
jgi:hypothetical protein